MIFWLIGLAANFYGWWCDFDESKRKPFYGKQEGNLFFRADNGQLNVKKAILIFALLEILPSVLLALFLHLGKGEGQSDSIGYWAGACWSVGFAVLHYITARKNIKRSKANRVRQIALRTEWRAKEWTREEFAQKYLKRTISNNGETFLLLFAWIRVPTQSNFEETLYTLADALIEWKKLPDSESFPDTKYQ